MQTYSTQFYVIIVEQSDHEVLLHSFQHGGIMFSFTCLVHLVWMVSGVHCRGLEHVISAGVGLVRDGT